MGCFVPKSKKLIKNQSDSDLEVIKYQKTVKAMTKDESIINLYKLEETLAILPYGTIVKAVHIPSTLLRSIKIMNFKIKESHYLNERHLRLEVDALSKLDHPNVLKVFDIIHDNLKLYIVMEY